MLEVGHPGDVWTTAFRFAVEPLVNAPKNRPVRGDRCNRRPSSAEDDGCGYRAAWHGHFGARLGSTVARPSCRMAGEAQSNGRVCVCSCPVKSERLRGMRNSCQQANGLRKIPNATTDPVKEKQPGERVCVP